LTVKLHKPLTLLIVIVAIASPASGQEKPVVGLIPKAQKPIAFDGKLTGWDDAFVTPVHAGHPDFANRGGQFLYLWDDKNLYIGLRCLEFPEDFLVPLKRSHVLVAEVPVYLFDADPIRFIRFDMQVPSVLEIPLGIQLGPYRPAFWPVGKRDLHAFLWHSFADVVRHFPLVALDLVEAPFIQHSWLLLARLRLGLGTAPQPWYLRFSEAPKGQIILPQESSL
jgi:hypothetical protein